MGSPARGSWASTAPTDPDEPDNGVAAPVTCKTARQPSQLSVVLMYGGITSFLGLATSAIVARLLAGKGDGTATVSVFIAAAFVFGVLAVLLSPRFLPSVASLTLRIEGTGSGSGSEDN
jgi:hypothetical protein